MYFCSWKMTNLNVRFFSHFILGTYLVDIKLITSHFLPIFTLINIRTRVPFKITSTPNNKYITKFPNLQKRVFPQKNKKTSPTRQYTYPQYTYNSYFSYRERRSFSMHNARKLHSWHCGNKKASDEKDPPEASYYIII